MNYLRRRDDLHCCWWCGKPAGTAKEEVGRFDWDGWPVQKLYERHWARCTSNCRCRTETFESKHKSGIADQIYGHDDPEAAVIEAWNAGDVSIPLTVTLPQSHYVEERVLLPTRSSIFKPSRMRIVIPEDRGTAEHFRKCLSVCIVADGQTRPHRFTMIEGRVIHSNVVLTGVKPMSRSSRFTVFCFEVGGSSLSGLGEGKVDTAWLRHDPPRAPVYDHVFSVIASSANDTEV